MISALLLAALELSPILSDRMVLQAETAVPIWGKADPGAKVQVTFRGKTASAKAGADGAWCVDLKAVPRDAIDAKGTDLVIAAGQETRTIRDVLVG